MYVQGVHKTSKVNCRCMHVWPDDMCAGGKTEVKGGVALPHTLALALCKIEISRFIAWLSSMKHLFILRLFMNDCMQWMDESSGIQ